MSSSVGDFDEAERLFEARRGYADASIDPYELAMTALDDAAPARCEDQLARERLDEARRLLDEHRIVLDPDDAFELDALASRFS
jgi:hypothetical protein